MSKNVEVDFDLLNEMGSKLADAEECATALDKIFELLGPNAYGTSWAAHEGPRAALRMVSVMIMEDLRAAISQAQQVNEKIGEAPAGNAAAA